MALPSKLRLLFVCATSLLCSGLATSETASPNSWFDEQLARKTEILDRLDRVPDERAVLVAIALLDDIYDLREQVSEPAAVDSLLNRHASDPNAHAVLHTEARYLLSLLAGEHVESANPEPLKALLKAAAITADNDVELQYAITVVSLFHRYSTPEGARPANHSNTPDDWYRTAKTASDDYHRMQALRSTLALDHDYVPAVLDMARRYSAQSQITRARTLLLATLKQRPAEASIRALLAEFDINQGYASAALVTMTELRSHSALSISVARELASSYAQLGFVKEARELAHFAHRLHPAGVEESELVARLDEEVGEYRSTHNIQRPEQSNGASARGSVTEIEPAKESDSDSDRLRRLLNGQPVEQSDPLSGFMANVPELIQKWRSRPAAERNESRILADVRVDELRPDYQPVKHVQQLIAVGPTDVSTYKTRAIQYSPQSQQLSVLRARLYHPDGRVAEADDLGDASLADASVSTYYDLRVRQYRFRDLRSGDAIELEYTISPLSSTNPYGKYFAELIAFGAGVPCDFQRYVLRSPRDIHLSSSEHLLGRATHRQQGSEDVYVWEKQQIPALVREPRSPAWSEQGAYVHVSNFASWQTLGKWYADLIRPQFTLNAQLEALVSDIVAQHPNRLDRVAAIDELVLKSTRYVALEFGVYGFKPYAVTETFTRRFGDCKDKASLMVALLRAAGITADIALVRTQRLGNIAAQPASASVFDHAIVYVPEFDLWLDGTAEFSRLRELPVEDQGVMALVVERDGNAILRRTPASSASDNYSRRTINARVEADGTIQFSGASYVRGEDAPELRRQLEPGDGKLGYVRDRLAQVLPAVELHDVELPLSSAEAVALSFNGELSSFHGRRIASLPSSWMERNYVASLASKTTRTQDLLIEAPWTTTEEIHIHLPEGARLTGVPSGQSFSSEFGQATIEYQVDGLEISVLSTVQFKATRIPATRYSAFRDFAAALDEAFHRDLEVELR